MTDHALITDEILHAFADGKLPINERTRVESWLAAHPDRAAVVAHWQRQNEALTALFAPVAKEPIPARLGPHLIAARRSAGYGALPRLAAAGFVLVCVGGLVGWFGRGAADPAPAPADLLVANAVTAHSLYVNEKRHAVEVAAAEEDHLVTWLSNRLQSEIEAPDLTAEGFALVGGRLLPEGLGTGAGPAAQLMYENASADRLTVYVTAALQDGAEGYEFTTREGLDAFSWANAEITCTVVGGLSDEAMQTVARKVYQQLTRRPDTSYVRGS